MKNIKSLGQHWLKDRIILDDIAFAAQNGNKNTLCLEIGPGLGTLTSSLFKYFNKILAVEFDQNLANNLPKSFPGKNLTVKNMDFLKFDLDKINEPYVIAGNIPYYITSPIIQKILLAKNKPEKVVLLIQKEVAERIAAVREQSLLSLLVQNKAEVTLGLAVPKEYFTPPPKVDSQVIILKPREKQIIDNDVFKLIKIGFSAPRKKLAANLAAGLQTDRKKIEEVLIKTGIDKDIRPAKLKLEDWKKVKNTIDN